MGLKFMVEGAHFNKTFARDLREEMTDRFWKHELMAEVEPPRP